MRAKNSLFVLPFALFFLFVASSVISAAEHPAKPIVVKLEGAKMAPVTFSHDIHVEKNKIDCVKCHHKDPKDPKACTTCHGSEAKGKTLAAKDAFHNRCQGCHKEAAAKGGKAPTKCAECHKK